jgi:hypothetical protein
MMKHTPVGFLLRRKEVIARKRLERAQKKDGDSIDLAEIAAIMSEYTQDAIREEGAAVEGTAKGDACVRTRNACGPDPEGDGVDAAHAHNKHDDEECQEEEEEDAAHRKEKMGQAQGGIHAHEMSIDEAVRWIDGDSAGHGHDGVEDDDAGALTLPPLSGEHLKVA